MPDKPRKKRRRSKRKLDTAPRKSLATTQKRGARVVLTFTDDASIRLNIPESVEVAIEK